MRKTITFALLAALVSGCDIKVSQGVAVDKGKDMLASTLKDPSSAKFGDAFFVESKMVGDRHYGFLCGRVNAKNSFGAYAGMSRFVADLEYTESGSFSMNNVLLEQGVLAKSGKDGFSIFETEHWAAKCTKPGAMAAK